MLAFLKSKRILFARLVVYSVIGFSTLLFLAWAVITMTVSNDDIHHWIVDFVEEQTGGKLEVEKVDFDVLTGIVLTKVKFFPPKHGDTRGYINKGEIAKNQIAEIDAVEVIYSVPSAIFGRFHLKALRLVAPKIVLRQNEEVWNFASVIAYREKAFPVQAVEDKKPEVKTSSSGFLPFSPALLYLPFNIRAKDVGISDLDFRLITIKDKKRTVMEADGLSIDLGLQWSGFESEFWFTTSSPIESPFIISIKTDNPKDDVVVKTALSSRLELKNLRHLAFDFLMKVDQLESRVVSYKDVEANAKIRINVDEDFRNISIDTCSTDLASSLLYNLGGTISLPENSLETIALRLKQSIAISLDNASKLIKPFAPKLTTSGEIRMDELTIEGDIKPQEMAKATEKASLPHIAGSIRLNGVAVNYPGVKMDPLSGSVSIAAGPALGEGGSQLDTVVNLLLPKFHLSQGDGVTAGFEELSTKATLRFLYPQMIAPIFKLNVEADHVIAKDGRGVNIDVPLFIDIDGEGRQDLKKVEITANIEMSELADISLSAQCSDQCTSFRTNNIIRLESLGNLYGVAMPFVGGLESAKFLPSTLGGSMDFQFTSRGNIPNPFENEVATLLRDGHIRFNTQFSLLKFNTDVPIYETSLKNFETRLMASGNMENQQIDLSTSFDNLSLSAPVDDKDQKIVFDRFSFSTEVNNSIMGEIDLSDPIHQLITKLRTKLYVGQASFGDLLPQPLSRLELSFVAEQNRLEEIIVKSLSASIPDVGAKLKLAAKAVVDEKFMPKSFSSEMEAKLKHSGSESIPGGIETSGEVLAKLRCNSSDMNVIKLDGKAAFKDFDFVFGAGTETSAKAKGITGEIPIKQVITLSEIKKKLAETKQGKAESGGDLTSAVESYFEKHSDSLKNSSNVVALVDYGTIRPFYPKRKPLYIRQLEVANLEMNDLEFDIELRQNWFSLNQFVISFLGGKIQGNFQLSFDPLPKSLRTSLHLTRLNTHKLLDRFPKLKGKKSWSLLSDPNLDATIHLKYDIRANDMSGGVEITSIGKEQMLMMLYFVDPHEKDPKISDIRKALNFGEVRLVSIPIKNGEIDLSVDVRVLAAPIPLPKLTRFPISHIVQNFKDQAASQSANEAADKKGDNEKDGDDKTEAEETTNEKAL